MPLASATGQVRDSTLNPFSTSNSYDSLVLSPLSRAPNGLPSPSKVSKTQKVVSKANPPHSPSSSTVDAVKILQMLQWPFPQSTCKASPASFTHHAGLWGAKARTVFLEVRENSSSWRCPGSNSITNSPEPRDSKGENGFTPVLTPVRVSVLGLHAWMGRGCTVCVCMGLSVSSMGVLMYVRGHACVYRDVHMCVCAGVLVCVWHTH